MKYFNISLTGSVILLDHDLIDMNDKRPLIEEMYEFIDFYVERKGLFNFKTQIKPFF